MSVRQRRADGGIDMGPGGAQPAVRLRARVMNSRSRALAVKATGGQCGHSADNALL